MPILNGVRDLGDLPTFDRIHQVSARRDEPMTLRGSAARRLALHLLNGLPIDFTLPALCAPPPSDMDLLFETEEAQDISDSILEIRESAPIYQGVRVESTSMAKVKTISESIGSYIDCPVWGVSIPAVGVEGFSDQTDKGLEELSSGDISFKFSGLNKRTLNKLDPELKFHLYAACFVYLKTCIDCAPGRGLTQNPAFDTVHSFGMEHRSLVEGLLTFDSDQSYYFYDRLLGIAYQMRASLGAKVFDESIRPLLPTGVSEDFDDLQAGSPMFLISKSDFYWSDAGSWTSPNIDWLAERVDLAGSTPLLYSPRLSLIADADYEDDFVECHIPLAEGLAELPVDAQSSIGAVIRTSLNISGEEVEIWLPSFCEAHRRTVQSGHDVWNLHVPLEPVNDLLRAVDGAESDSASIEICLFQQDGGPN